MTTQTPASVPVSDGAEPAPDAPLAVTSSAESRVRRVTRKGAPDSVYVGRPTFLGNPFAIGRDGDRAEVIAKYAVWFAEQVADPSFAERVRSYCADYDLACWCASQACHADVIVRWLDA